MARERYLADTSAFSRLTNPQVASVFGPLAAARQIALCLPVLFELGFSAQSPADYEKLMDGLSSFPVAPVTHADHGRTLEVQAILSGRSQHRALSSIDGLVAAIAEARGLTVLHYDGHFELVAEVTGQAHRWIVPPGTAD